MLAIGLAVTTLLLPFALRGPLASWPPRVRRSMGRALVALRHLAHHPGAGALALVMSLAIQGVFVLLNVRIGAAIGIHLALPVWFIAWPLAKIAGLLPISLGGLAVRDATFAEPVLPLGVPMAQGVVAALAWQTVMITGGLLGGLAWWLLRSRSARPGSWSWSELLATARRHA